MNKPQFLVLENPGEFDALDDRTAELFEEVDRKTLPLLDKIIKPFADMNKEKTGLHNTRRPKEVETNQYTYGNVVITVKTTPTTLRTNYQIVVEEVESFLDFVKNDYEEGRQRKGVLTIEDKPYIDLGEVIEQIEGLKAQTLEGKAGIKQEVSFNAPEHMIAEGLEKVIYKIGNDYSAPIAENAADFVRASALKAAIQENFYKEFIDSLSQSTGYSDENVPEQTVQEFVRAGNYLFPVQVIPKDNIKYGKIIEALIKPYNKKITPNTGELIRLHDGAMDDVLKRYDPKTRDGTIYIHLNALIDRLDEIKYSLTTRSCSYKIERSIRLGS